MSERPRSSRIDPDLLIVGLFIVLCVAVGTPAIILHLRGEDVTYGPPWLWIGVYVGFIVTYLATSVLADQPRRHLALGCFLVQEVLAVASVLLIHSGLSFVNIILVLSAAVSCYVLPRWGTALLVVMNTAVVVASTNGVAEQAVNGMFYLAVQAVSVVTVHSWMSIERSRRELAEAHVELAATATLLEQSTRTEERLRISRDLHDVAGHQLTALALELEIASHQVDGEATTHVRRARAIAKDLLGNVRDTVSQLRDNDGSLTSALEQVTSGITRPRIELLVDEVDIDPDHRTALVRATQEILTNTIRHARDARLLRIDVSCDQDRRLVILEADDDGSTRGPVTPGNGLKGLRERAEHLGGTAEFARRPGGGFHVRMAVPLP